jgi:DNA polymerase III alpha subunit (gram-positive type)
MMKPYSDKLLAITDSETSGLLSDEHELLELAVILYDRQQDQVLKEWTVKIAPRHIHTAQDQALKVNGYANDPTSYKTNIKSALIKFNKLTDDCILVGQNIAFDIAFVRKAMAEFSIEPKFDRRALELMSMAWFYVCDRNLNGLSLKDLCSYFNISNIGAHGALVDCRRCLGVYRCLNGMYNPQKK